MGDVMDIEILEDGTISITTGKISDTNHASADELLDTIEEMLGGERVTRKRKKKLHIHNHKHIHLGGKR